MSKLTVNKVPTVKDRDLPIFDEFNDIAEKIRVRAYSLFAGRDSGEGNHVDDWLNAEREICWPTAELVEEDDAFKVKVALAGFGPQHVSVTATPRELMIKASQRDERNESEEKKGVKVCWSEFSSNDVYRHIDFPADVEVDKVTADFKQGVLEIEAPKSRTGKKSSSKKIKVSS